jgi:hypothetical protein
VALGVFFFAMLLALGGTHLALRAIGHVVPNDVYQASYYVS